MFGIGTTEIIIILVVALLVIGPTKLPEVAKSLGKGMAEFKRMSSDVKDTIDWETQVKQDESARNEDSSTAKEPPEIGSDVSTPDDEIAERPVDEANLQQQSEDTEDSGYQEKSTRDYKEQDKDER